MQPPDEPAQARSLIKLLACLAIVLGAGALLAPPLYWAAKSVVQAGFGSSCKSPFQGIAESLAEAEFTRVFNRAMLVSALALFWPLSRWAGLRGLALPPWRPAASGGRELLAGFLPAVILLLALGGILWSQDVYKSRPETPWLALSEPLIAAFSVGFIEEFLFRGALLALLLRTLSRNAAVLWSAFIFAIVHFLKPPEGFAIPHEEVGWLSGFAVVRAIFAGFGNVNFLLAELATLFAVGYALARARLATGRLWLCVGLHAGWVFGLKYFSSITRVSGKLNRGDYLPWIGDNLKIGLLPLAVVLITGWLAIRLAGPRSSGGKTIAG